VDGAFQKHNIEKKSRTTHQPVHDLISMQFKQFLKTHKNNELANEAISLCFCGDLDIMDTISCSKSVKIRITKNSKKPKLISNSQKLENP